MVGSISILTQAAERPRFVALGANLVLLGLVAVAAGAAAEPSRAIFAWPDSGRVTVELQRFHLEKRSALRWELRWRPVAEGLRLEIHDAELVALEVGDRILDPSSELGRSLRVLDQMIPAWEVDTDGRFRRWVDEDYEARLRSLHRELGSPSRQDSSLVSTTSRLLGNAELQREARARGRLFWRAAVQDWIGVPWEESWVDADSLDVDYLGASGAGELTREVEALPVFRGFDLAHLRSAFEAAVDDRGRQRERNQVVEARIERASLRPLTVHVRTSVQVQHEGEILESSYEELLFQFHWSDLPR